MDLYYIDIVCFELFFNGLFYFIIIDWSRGLSVFRHISENLFGHRIVACIYIISWGQVTTVHWEQSPHWRLGPGPQRALTRDKIR